MTLNIMNGLNTASHDHLFDDSFHFIV